MLIFTALSHRLWLAHFPVPGKPSTMASSLPMLNMAGRFADVLLSRPRIHRLGWLLLVFDEDVVHLFQSKPTGLGEEEVDTRCDGKVLGSLVPARGQTMHGVGNVRRP